jgi:SPP1 gp7 family putative phage head morphogenesis protein
VTAASSATRDRVETAREKAKRKREEFKAEREFQKAHNAAASYGRALRNYARQIGHIIAHYAEGDPPMVPAHKMPELTDALRRYRAGTLPWARAASARMVAEVNRRNLTVWQRYTEGMSTALRTALFNAPIGEAVQALLDYQVELITSLPLEAAQRVHEASLEAMAAGSRYPERSAIEQGWDPEKQMWTRGEPELTTELERAVAAANPLETTKWVLNRATLIARTETARSASVLVQARAQYVGAESYIWKTAGDWKVRASHRRLNNHEFRWDDPPLSDPPDHHSHPGQIWNCRCVALPVLE